MLLPALGVLALAGTAVLLLSRTGADKAAVESKAPSAIVRGEDANAPARSDRSAMIVDEATVHPEPAMAPDQGATTEHPGVPAADAAGGAAAATAAVEAPAGVRTPGNNPFDPDARPAATATARRPPTTKPAPAAGAGSESESKLLAVLLANIQSPTAGREASPLDVLLQDMAAEEDAAGATAAVGGQSRPTRMRSQQIQSNLRECPPANTAKGLACRQEICAVYAGRDPACPAG